MVRTEAPRRTVAAIIPIKDRFDLARLAVESVINQEWMVDELIIVDDGSEQAAEGALRDVLDHGRVKGIRVIVLRDAQSRGVSAARNRGVAASSADLVFFCDSDDFWHPQKVRLLIEKFDSYPEMDVVFHSFFWTAGQPRSFSLFRVGFFGRMRPSVLFVFAMINPSCLALKRAVYGNGFDESMRHHEDADFTLRLSRTNPIWFYHFPLTFMGRPPGTANGATADWRAMRLGAIRALSNQDRTGWIGSLAALKVMYHRAMLKLGK